VNGKWSDPFISRAFEQFGLDPLDPFNWRTLLGYFAEAHFKKSKIGAPKKWTERRQQILSAQVRAIRKHRSDLSPGAMARVVKELWKDDYKDIQARTLEKRLNDLLRAN
jgi:hypothetical protein